MDMCWFRLCVVLAVNYEDGDEQDIDIEDAEQIVTTLQVRFLCTYCVYM